MPMVLARLTGIVTFVTTAMLTARPVSAQSTHIPHSVSCASCRVVFEPVVTLGSPTDSVLLGSSSAARDSRGRYYVVGHGGMSIVVFDSTGRYMRAIGRAGQGPGEIATRIVSVSVHSDSLFVFTTRRRLSVFSPSYDHIRTLNYGPMMSGSGTSRPVDARGNFVLPGNVRSDIAREDTSFRGFHYHLMAADGSYIRSFGKPDSIDISAPSPTRTTASITPLDFMASPDGTYLLGVDSEYRFTRWNISSGEARNFQVVQSRGCRTDLHCRRSNSSERTLGFLETLSRLAGHNPHRLG